MTTHEWQQRTAEEWFARRRSDDISADEQRCFAAWLEIPQNTADYQATESAWQQAERVKGYFAVAVTTHDEQPVANGDRRKAQAAGRRAHTRMAWVASFLLAVLAGTLLLTQQTTPEQVYETALTTRVGERRTVALPDGSQIELAVNSKLSVSFNAAIRRVVLYSGEAFFDVASDAERPFVIENRGHVITVVGTQFNVDTRAAQTLVTLIKGEVNISTLTEPMSTLTLQPGETAAFSDNRRMRLTNAVAATELAWRSGNAVFSDVPLSEVIASLRDYHESAITLSPSAANMRVSGVIPIEELSTTLETLQSLIPITLSQSASGYLISAQNRNPDTTAHE